MQIEKKRYCIYRLFNKRNPDITRYVGMTTNLILRFSQHLLCTGESPSKDAWIRASGGDVDREVIEEMWTTLQEAKEREAYWIGTLLLEGAPLLNQSIPKLASKIFHRNDEEFNYYRIEVPLDSPLYRQLMRDARQSGMLNEIGKMIGIRVADHYKREGQPVSLPPFEREAPTLDNSKSNAAAALDEWGL